MLMLSDTSSELSISEYSMDDSFSAFRTNGRAARPCHFSRCSLSQTDLTFNYRE